MTNKSLDVDARPRRQRRKQERPQELLDAALELFVQKGYAATHSEEVARRAGVSKGTLYLYYPSKEELFKAVVRSNLSNLIAEGADLADHYEGPTRELLMDIARIWWERIGSRPAAGLHRVLLAELQHVPELQRFYAEEVVAPADALFKKALQRGIERGEFRTMPIEEACYALIAPLLFRALDGGTLWAPPPRPIEELLELQFDILLRGIERRDGAAPVPIPGSAHPPNAA
ncbi:TetR/AcrR family transcriptional regulator [Rubrivivax gelatinosus]|uniref:Transcriptional regulator, TetR family n=1 Tax=Rubrivivax gelatinosus (strain NBRC 100245 / IL144) TaxID=983917 RepID=I0HV07_RUBGI|nr:TetR/AcrR family transcriptional regulator [Rubrivivax gelatinosus]MBG6078777.1 AcrR family transcriptional regulator [Rubrivivax gelatinosus]BAL96844.1 transcriptional regulator, TetR family [Rubrivivax gelatinosus IL144]